MTQPELPGPLAALTRLISERIAAADFAGALPLMNELVAVCRPILGERHPNVLDMKLALVHLQLQMGDQAGAYAALEQLVPELDELLGRDHITTLTARHMFADRPQRETQAALAEWSQLLADEERVLGPEHPTALTSRDRVAQKRKELGDYAGAIAEGERVVAARRRVLGEHHEDTLGMRMALAQWRGESADGPGAVAELETLVEVMREKLGDDHRHTLIARHTIALWEPEPDDYRDKVATWQALVDDEARVFGDDNPITVAAREELAKWRDRAQEYRWVTETRDRVEEATKRRLRAKHQATQRFSDEEYLRCWLAERGAQFPVWAGRYGGDAVWDFSPESLDALEELVIQNGSSPEELLDEERNAPFVDGAVWYLGEVLRRGRSLPWQYTRGEAADPTVGYVDVFDALTRVLHSVDRGALRRTYDRFTASG
ncbi:tetratricopeptide repeat protein [Mycobacterium sp. HNNTM2301]|uniref:tetratricopeptide repeat protein n=1 Tax=Mycobacterium hainanense TaxID=3289775 RepID=UPI0035A6E809